MIRFNNDYNRGAHPEILNALLKTNTESYEGYGCDSWCKRAEQEIKKYLNRTDVNIHFLVGGTQTNRIVISAALKPHQSVISASTGHINVHETGAIENCGHKIHPLPHTDGKISAEQVSKEAAFYYCNKQKEHYVQPKMVYLSFPTEYGTIYSKEELEEISHVCKEYNLYLFIDGARLSYGLCAENAGVTLQDIAQLSDVFYCGGTKCGALFGEAVIITNPVLQEDFRNYMKQNGALLAKGWLLGIQFYTLFKNGLYFSIAKRANDYARKLKQAFAERGIQPYIDSPTNQQFFVLENGQIEKLGKKYTYEYEAEIDSGHSCIRLCTSWSTKECDIDELINDICML